VSRLPGGGVGEVSERVHAPLIERDRLAGVVERSRQLDDERDRPVGLVGCHRRQVLSAGTNAHHPLRVMPRRPFYGNRSKRQYDERTH